MGADKPELKKFMDKRLAVKINGSRRVIGVLRGFDQYMNIVLDDAYEEVSQTERNAIGMVVLRGNAVILIEPLERV